MVHPEAVNPVPTVAAPQPLPLRVGAAYRRSTAVARGAALVAVVAVLGDVALVAGGVATDYARLLVSVPAAVALFWLGRFDPGSLGLTLRPRPGWGYWLRVTLWLGAAMGLLLAAYCAVFPKELEQWRHLGTAAAADPWRQVKHSCVMAPVVEELPYRVLLCSPLVVILRERWTIALSGAIFAALHFLYGTASPENFVAGYVLAWAYLASGSVAVPVGLHALGNLATILSNIALSRWG
jgi:uncharacterized protein